MGTRDPRVDAYIAKSADFAQPILEHVREVVHQACPDVVETMKWSMPAFEYQGLLCTMASFKQHASFGFWKHALVVGEDLGEGKGMGSFGKLTTVKDLPNKRTLTSYVKRAMKLNAEGVKTPREKNRTKPAGEMHPDFAKALAKKKKAKAFFDGLAPGQQREYMNWITEAKRDATRETRIAQAVEWLGEGKKRHWKYENC